MASIDGKRHLIMTVRRSQRERGTTLYPPRTAIDARMGRAIDASVGADRGALVSVHGVCLLFAPGERPDRSAIREFALQHATVAVAFDPAEKPPLQAIDPQSISAGTMPEFAEHQWIELVHSGLTFDLRGLVPPPGVDIPEVDYQVDFTKRPSKTNFEAIELVPGSHLSGGERTLPVLKAMFALARDIVHHFSEIEAVVWAPSRSVIGRRFFESTVTAWVEGGAFPALGLTAFRETMDGGLQSVGLDYLIGQELRIEPSLAADKVAATRLGVRLINQLVLVGRVTEGEYVIAPDGQRLRVEPSENGKFVRVQGE